MSECKCLFVTGTGTDVGKTYVSALIVKKLREANINAGYYKMAVSGATKSDNDAIYAARTAGVDATPDELVSYVYKEAVSPHLAAKINNRPIEREKLAADFSRAKSRRDFLLVEGSGGIVCPLRYDSQEKFMLADMATEFSLPVVIVANAELGSINAAVLTVEYIRARKMPLRGIILNGYDENDAMQRDNRDMIAALTGEKILAAVPHGAGTTALPSNVGEWFL